MLCSLKSPAVEFDLLGLASTSDGIVSVGRETNTAVRLECAEVPFLLSRRHALFSLQPDGSMAITDCASTNGTYLSRANQPLRKLTPHVSWVLQDGDVIGFGGPDTILARQVQVANPFIFKFYGSQEAAEAADEASFSTQEDHPMADHQSVAQSSLREPLAERQAALGVLSHNSSGRSLDDKSVIDLTEPSSADEDNKENSRAAAGPPSSSGSGMAELLGNHLACPICHEWLLASHTLSCGHMFCGPCLAHWLPQKQSCPTCRKAIAGIPVRCFTVDNTITDLLQMEAAAASPATKMERKRKQAHWEGVQGQVTQDWALALKRRQERALEAANRHRALLASNAAARGPEVQGAQA